jgi:uncharacterized DUF497 family protein
MEWDDRKAASNQKKHGVSFALAERFPFESAIEALDPESEEHGEERYHALGKIDRSIYALIYTKRRGKIRVISLRKADARERAIYRSGGTEWR